MPATDIAPESAPFTPAKSSKRRKNKNRLKDLPSLSASYARTREELAQDDWLQQTQSCLTKCITEENIHPSEILCLGLGSPSSSRASRAQLALLMHISNELNIDRDRIQIFDPVLTPEDKKFLTEDLGVRVGNSPLLYSDPTQFASPTLLYMPHCEYVLYESVLAHNWRRDRLVNMMFLANELALYTLNPSAAFQTRTPHLCKILPHLSAHTLPPSTAFMEAFSSLAVQAIRAADLPPDNDTEFWRKLSERTVDADFSKMPPLIMM